MTVVNKALKIHYPSTQEFLYKKLFARVTNLTISKIKKLTDMLLYQLKNNRTDSLVVRNDDFIDDIKAYFEQLENEFSAQIPIFATYIYYRATQLKSDAVKRFKISIKPILTKEDIKIDIFDSEFNPELNLLIKSWVNTNVSLIKRINTDMLSQIKELIETSYRTGNSISYIRTELVNRFNFTLSRAELNARTQISQLNSCIVRYTSLKYNMPLYIWSTNLDGRERASHRVLNGKICTWENPNTYKDNIEDKAWKDRNTIGGDKTHVGMAINCRCTDFAIIN